MPRRKGKRNIEFSAHIDYYKPAGIPLRDLEEVVLEADEIEAIRLANLENMYQEDAARSMGVSRQTFGRILSSANNKIAEGLIIGKAIRIEKSNSIPKI